MSGVQNYGNVTGSNIVGGNVRDSTLSVGASPVPASAAKTDSGKPRRPERSDPDASYHLAFTFANEQRDYVRATKEECEDLGLAVMYDFDHSIEWWGKDFTAEQRKIYSARTLFVVAFISDDYIGKPVPMDEFRAALWTDLQRGGGYILPVLMDGAKPPVEMVLPSVAIEAVTDGKPGPAELAVRLNAKVLSSLLSKPRQPRALGDFARHSAAEPVPPAVALEPIAEILAHVRSRLLAERATVRAWDGTLTVAGEDKVRVDVVLGGDEVYELTLRKFQRADDQLVITVHRHNGGGELREQAVVVAGKYGAPTKVRLTKRGLLPGIEGQTLLTKEDLAERIWHDIRTRLGR